MKNEVTYFPNAKWAVLEGAFTADDLRDVIARIENPSLQNTPIKSEERSQEAIQTTLDEANARQKARQATE